VKEARRVNIMIEEEKERMRMLKQRMIDNNLAQYVNITQQEIKVSGGGTGGGVTSAKVKAGKVPTADSVEAENENNSDDDSLPGLIPPID
jgi:hypothetical protein